MKRFFKSHTFPEPIGEDKIDEMRLYGQGDTYTLALVDYVGREVSQYRYTSKADCIKGAKVYFRWLVSTTDTGF